MSAIDEFGYSATDEFKDELKQMVTVTESGTGGGYEWDDFVAYWHPTRRRFYYLSDSGCSCNSISDGVNSLADFSDVGTLGELVLALKREKTDGSWGWSQTEIARTVNEIMAFRS